MKNIRKIFFTDVIALFRNPLALIIAGGLCLLPALYAWFNIYSNWDPYGNTKNIQIAVASNDEGYTNADGVFTDAAYTIINSLQENKSISWVTARSEHEALKGVYDGSYYAAVVFEQDFTECMYHGFLDGLKRPTVSYYENEKKNAVATKITDTAVAALQTQINEQYITLVVSTFFDRQQGAVNSIDTAGLVQTMTDKIAQAKKTVDNFAVIVKSLIRANDKLTASMEGAGSDLDTIRSHLDSVQQEAGDVPDVQALSDKLHAGNTQALQSVGNALNELKQAQKAETAAQKNAVYQKLSENLSNAKSSLDELIGSLQSINAATLNVSPGIVLTQLQNQSQVLQDMITRIAANQDTEDTGMLSQIQRQMEQQILAVQQVLQTTVSQSLSMLGNELLQISSDITRVTGNLMGDIDLLGMILKNGTTAVSLTNQSFSSMKKELNAVSRRLDEMAALVKGISETQFIQSFLDFMQGNSAEYGAFFAQPVSIETQSVYPVANYGSGVAAFYTTLALWVGAVILVSLIKVKAQEEGLDQPKPYELFFGRYLLFFVLAMLQAVITVWGNFYLL
ncbi:MAG: YhgE/Pip domain-containing protein, partial [Eubacterium sp.]|nr:YhgE/Pip domain-containing protein [Eubacterium sp.]